MWFERACLVYMLAQRVKYGVSWREIMGVYECSV